jgi:dihydroxyacetone kinase DhaKLM complex PTS-EIIA-like component DhaM
MVGIVVVSHSADLARAAVGLALQMVQGPAPRIEIAAGTPDDRFGTDAVRVAEAIAAADDGEGVVVIMDLGSAVLSAELALELLPPSSLRPLAPSSTLLLEMPPERFMPRRPSLSRPRSRHSLKWMLSRRRSLARRSLQRRPLSTRMASTHDPRRSSSRLSRPLMHRSLSPAIAHSQSRRAAQLP